MLDIYFLALAANIIKESNIKILAKSTPVKKAISRFKYNLNFKLFSLLINIHMHVDNKNIERHR